MICVWQCLLSHPTSCQRLDLTFSWVTGKSRGHRQQVMSDWDMWELWDIMWAQTWTGESYETSGVLWFAVMPYLDPTPQLHHITWCISSKYHSTLAHTTYCHYHVTESCCTFTLQYYIPVRVSHHRMTSQSVVHKGSLYLQLAAFVKWYSVLPQITHENLSSMHTWLNVHKDLSMCMCLNHTCNKYVCVWIFSIFKHSLSSNTLHSTVSHHTVIPHYHITLSSNCHVTDMSF